MAKALRTAALVVGAAALVATGVGAAGSAGLLGAAVASGGTVAGIATAATLTSIGAIAGAVGGVISLAAAATTPKGSVGGNATKFKIDKDAGLPVVLGRTYSGGNVVHRQYYGSKQQKESWVTVHSIGPIKSLGPLQVDKVAVGFDAGGQAVGFYRGYMWLDQQLGACPEARALRGPIGDFPGWNATSKLSGLAADLWTLDFDTKGKKFPNSTPQRGRVVEGVFAYDPRLDSTYPGGVGTCRIADPATWPWSENPALNALTWAYGHIQNGVLVAGGGLKVRGIDLGPFVEWANVCDANGWKVGGIVYATTDNSWDVLKMIAQAGGGEVMPVGALLSCTFSAPRVSIGKISTGDVMGDVDTPSTASRRLRRNTVIPRVRLESQGWEVVPLDALSIPEYVAVDGGKRPKEIEFPLVQGADQGAQLGVYELMNLRELDGIVVPAKVYAIGYRPGDCITLDIPEASLVNRDVIIRNREINGSTMGITLTCRTETPGKHAFALGRVGTPPPTPDLSIPLPDLAAPDAADWALAGASLTAGGASIPALVLTGAVTNPTTEAVIFEYRPAGVGAAWASAGTDSLDTVRKEFTGVTPGTSYEVAVSYQARGLVSERLVVGPVTAGTLAVSRSAYRIVSQSVSYPVTSDADSITVAAFSAVLDDGRSFDFPTGAVEGLTSASSFVLLWRFSTSTYVAVLSPGLTEVASPDYAIIRYVMTANADGTYPGTGTPPGGDGGGGGGGYIPRSLEQEP